MRRRKGGVEANRAVSRAPSFRCIPLWKCDLSRLLKIMLMLCGASLLRVSHSTTTVFLDLPGSHSLHRPPTPPPPVAAFTTERRSSSRSESKTVFGLSRIHKIQLSLPSLSFLLPVGSRGFRRFASEISFTVSVGGGRPTSWLVAASRPRSSFRRDVCYSRDALKRNYGHEWY